MARVEFSAGVQRFMPFMGYHHFLMVLTALAIILLSLLLAGCSSSSPLIPGIFLLSLYYDAFTPDYSPVQVDPGVATTLKEIVGTATTLEVRIGYFGICIAPSEGDFLCSNNATLLAQQVGISEDPLNLIWVADTFRSSVVFPYLIIVALILIFITFLALATFPGWHETQLASDTSTVDLKPFPSRFVSQITLITIFSASIFLLISVLWQHTASVAGAQVAQDIGNGSVRSGVGVSAMVLGWFGFALGVFVMIGLLIMILSIHVLEVLTDSRDSRDE